MIYNQIISHIYIYIYPLWDLIDNLFEPNWRDYSVEKTAKNFGPNWLKRKMFDTILIWCI